MHRSYLLLLLALHGVATGLGSADDHLGRARDGVASAQRALSECRARSGKLRAQVACTAREVARVRRESVRAEERVQDLGGALSKYDDLVEHCRYLVSGVNLTRLGDGLYYFHGERKNWAQSSDFCKQHGMDLLSIETQEENIKVKDWVSQILEFDPPLLCAPDPHLNAVFWTSLYDVNVEGTYLWAGTGQPAEILDSFPGDDSRDCGVIGLFKRSPTAVTWGDLGCGEGRRFVCEVPGPCSELLRDRYLPQVTFRPDDLTRSRVDLNLRCLPPK